MQVRKTITDNYRYHKVEDIVVFKGTNEECSEYLRQEAIRILNTYNFVEYSHLSIEFSDGVLSYNIDNNNDFVIELKIEQ